MTAEQTADTFRTIDNLAAEARRSLQAGDERVVARGLLSTIQSIAQKGLRNSLAKNKGEMT